MKKSLLLILLFTVAGVSYGQTKAATTTSSGSCFKDWYSLFRDRGADPVPDGMNDVIITLRNGDFSDCFMGKVEIKSGALAARLQIQKLDGNFEDFEKRVSAAFAGPDGRIREEFRTITDGMSASVQLADGELIRLFFYKSLKAKPLGNKKAPNPSQLVKN